MQKAAFAQHPGCDGTPKNPPNQRPSAAFRKHAAFLRYTVRYPSSRTPNWRTTPYLPTLTALQKNLHSQPKGLTTSRWRRTQHELQTATHKRKLYKRGRHQTSFAGKQANYQHFNAFTQRLLSFPEHCDCHRLCRCTEALRVISCRAKERCRRTCDVHRSVEAAGDYIPEWNGCLQFRKHHRPTPSIYCT